ncbi:hypothetical protein JEQ12_019540 [Ovis aries]|uniref:Uncharacterized protein n=1 Tax=Ovis aries TaxID=9940 RepID=A0A836CZ93_SHEEP|nr:hypothetical protein JEQ12_019540 [Ovis aries]
MFTFTVNITLIINHFTSGGCPLVNLRDLSAIICRERLQDDVEEVSTELPIHRTPFEHNIVWKMLKTIPDLTSQLLDEHLKILSKNVISETWIKGSTGECGLEEYILILKCTCVFTATKVFSMGHKDSSLKVTLIFSKPHKCLLDRRIGKEGRMSIRGGFTVTVSDLVSKRNLLPVLPSVTALKGSVLVFGKVKKTAPVLADVVIVETGNIISFVAYINSGYCKIYRNIIGFSKLQSRKVVFNVAMPHVQRKRTLDPVTKQLMLQTAKPTFGHLSDEDVKKEYLQKEQKREWKSFKKRKEL